MFIVITFLSVFIPGRDINQICFTGTQLITIFIKYSYVTPNRMFSLSDAFSAQMTNNCGGESIPFPKIQMTKKHCVNFLNESETQSEGFAFETRDNFM